MSPRDERYRLIENQLRPFVLIESADGSLGSFWPQSDRDQRLAGAAADQTMQQDLADRLQAYFEGCEVTFDDVPTPAGSPFYRQCWDACRRIPRGQTRSYAELAKLAGSDAGAARAAGQAMRRNPLPIIVPCHRVIGAGGGLHGFAGSADPAGEELALKQKLLMLEGRAVDGDNVPLFAAVS